MHSRIGEPGRELVTSVVTARRLEWILVLVIVVSDQITKALIRQSLALHESVPLVSDLLALTRVHNTGAAFGMFNAMEFPGKTLVLTGVAALALVGVAWYATSIPFHDRLARLGVASILGGAIGNLIDRATAGYVLDFVDASWQGWHFWAFNVADAAITIGVVLMILDLVGLGRRASNPV
jgi:signal peptidase II